MMRSTLGIAAILLLLTSGLCAQPDTAKLHDAKMKMIREAVNFYSLDTRLSKTPVNCESEDVSGLKDCAKNMDKVGARIEKWNKVAVTDEAALKALAETIIEDVTAGADKQHRLKIAGYKDFESRVKEYGDTKVEQVDMTAGVDQPSPSSAVPPDNTPGPSLAAPQTGHSSAVSESSAATGPFWKDPFILSVIAILTAVSALLVALMAKNRKSHRRSGSSREMPPVFQEYSSPGSQLNLVALEEKIARLSSELDSANEIIREMDRRLSGKVQQLETKEAEYAPRLEQNFSTPQFAINKRWAKNVDGGGFEMDALSSEPDSKMIYEITQTGPHAATFKVSEIRDAQLFALSNPQNYLREGCNYTSQPSLNSQIRTEVPGTLELQGRKWRIINPAQIAFS